MLQYWMSHASDKTATAGSRESYANNVIQNFPGSKEAEEMKQLLPRLSAEAEEERTDAAWSYSNSEDAMSSGRVGYAQVESENVLTLDFPYQGPQRGRLAVRHHPKWGRDVIVSVEKGQILCSSYECPVRIRFDNSQPVTYVGNEPADNSSDTVFLPNSIEKKLKVAKHVKIEMNFFQNGTQVLEFNVKGFDPEKMKQ